MKSRFDKLYKTIMEEVDDFNFSEQQKQDVIDVLKKFGFYEEWKDYIDQICEEMYNVHKYSKVQLKQIDKEGVQAILNDVDSGWLEEHDDYVEESKKINTSKKHLIKEEMEPGYWEKVDQYNKDIQAYLDKGDGEEYDGFDGYVDEDDFYTTIEEIAAQNKDKLPALENELLSYIESCPGGDSGDSMDGSLGLYQDIIEGNEGYAESNIFYGLTDPETWTNLGFNVPEELAVLLKAHFVDCVDPDGSFWEGYGNDGADDSAQYTLNNMGLNKVVEAIEKIRSGEYDDQDQDYDDED